MTPHNSVAHDKRGVWHHRTRVAAAVLSPVAALALVLGFAAPALALNPERHYEMVSPVFKGGNGATHIAAVSPNGESVGFYSAGAFAETEQNISIFPVGSHYLARRGPSGWSTVPAFPPSSLLDAPFLDVSPDMSTEFAIGYPGPSLSEEQREHVKLMLHLFSAPDTAQGWQQVGEMNGAGHLFEIDYSGASADFCHVLFYAKYGSREQTAVQPLPEAEGTRNQLYEYDRGCGGEPSAVRLVAVNNSNVTGKRIIDRNCDVDLGDITYTLGSPSEYYAIDEDGNEVFFTDCFLNERQSGEPGELHQLYVRLGGARTVEVSRPLMEGGSRTCSEVPCAEAAERASADFQGASEDGSKVYFTAALKEGHPLVPGDNDTSTNLYLARIGCPAGKPGCAAAEREVASLSEPSHDLNGAAGVQGVLRVAPDGRRVYFVATGDLLGASEQQALEREGRPVPHAGAENLYVYDDAGGGSVSFIADLCTGSERSGMAEDVRCPGAGKDIMLWAGITADSGGESQTAGPQGEFLVFSTYAQLVGTDVNAAKDVYRYDALTGALTLVSIGVDGYEPNGSRAVLGSSIQEGHRGGWVYEQHELDRRAISEDGSRIVFTSAEPLSPDATNGLVNAYEWHEGRVSLVSTGSDLEPVSDVVISADGSSVLFDTVQGLVSQDTDGLPDVYDARLGAGFPSLPEAVQPCEGDGCQGPLTNPALLLVPGSAAQVAGQNVSPPAQATVKARRKPKPKSNPRCKRGEARTHTGCPKAKRRAHRALRPARGRRSSAGGRS